MSIAPALRLVTDKTWRKPVRAWTQIKQGDCRRAEKGSRTPNEGGSLTGNPAVLSPFIEGCP